MKKSALIAAIGSAALGLTLSGTVLAEASAKFAYQIYNPLLMNAETNADWELGNPYGNWSSDIMTAELKTSNATDLLIGVSLETSLFTYTLVQSKNGNKDTSTAEGMVKIKVLIDGQPAEPNEVVFDRRLQELSATLGGVIESCEDGSDGSVPDGEIVIADECEVTPEEISLLLDTTGAHHFNFVMPNVGVGMHTIAVHAELEGEVTAEDGDAKAGVIIGQGSLTVEEVRSTKAN